MKFEKILTKEWPMCYVASSLKINDVVYGAFASESHDTTGAVAINMALEETPLWEAPDGCMGIVQIPGKNEFLSIQRFYPIFQSENAEISWYYQENDIWIRKVLFTVPFVHRIEVLRENGQLYLLICKLCQSKSFIDDWSTAGSVLVCRIHLDSRSADTPASVLEGLYKNHGLVKLPGENDRVLVAHSGGIHEIAMASDGSWQSKLIFHEPCSDVAITNLKEDGSYDEIGVITPFHGSDFRILRREDHGWKEVCSIRDSFGHGIWGGILAGKTCYLAGYRAGTQSIFCIERHNDTYCVMLVDVGVGNANLSVFRWNGYDYIGAANRESNSITIYRVEAE